MKSPPPDSSRLTLAELLNAHRPRTGRKPSVSREWAEEVVREYLTSGLSLRDLAAKHGVGLGVVKRAVKRVRERIESSEKETAK